MIHIRFRDRKKRNENTNFNNNLRCSTRKRKLPLKHLDHKMKLYLFDSSELYLADLFEVIIIIDFIIRCSSKRKEKDKEKSDYAYIVIAKYARHGNKRRCNQRTSAPIKYAILKLSSPNSTYKHEQ